MSKKEGKHGIPLADLEVSLSRHILQARTKDLDYSESRAFFLNPPTKELPLFFHSPFQLPDMQTAVQLFLELSKKSNSDHPILLFGDRDSDGVSSTALLTHYIRNFFPDVKCLSITSSQNDAYGLCPEAMARIRKIKPILLITLDFGTSNHKEIIELHNENISTIVLDHHETPDIIPPCQLINPKRDDSNYPDKKICTAFLALKFIVAVQFARSSEYNKVYMVKEDLFGGPMFCNGVPFDPDENKSFSMNEVTQLSLGDLPGDESIPLANRVFYKQISQVPELLKTQYEASGLAGIGTITDMMPLVGENRSLVKLSCHYLSYSLQGKIKGIPGLTEILKSTKLRPEKISSKDMGWTIGPLINAAGRMGRTELAFDLLLTPEESTAVQKTQELIKTNDERKERTKRNIYKVDLYFQRHPDKTNYPIVFCYEPDMEPGVSGIVATRMVETFSKPAIFITPDHGKARGSIRSIGKENVLDLLKTADDILDQFGGHPEAGGFSVDIHNIPLLEKRFLETSENWLKNTEDFIPEIRSDIRVRPEDLTGKLWEELEILEPTGQGNPQVLLSLENVEPVYLNFMGDGRHARFRVMGAGSLKFVIWNIAEEFSNHLNKSPKVSIWGHLEENYFQGKSSLQFSVSHFE